MRSKQFRALLTVVLAASLLSSCLKIRRIDQGGGPETDPVSPLTSPETDAPETMPLAPDPDPAENRTANFDLGLLTEQDSTSSLLSRHDSVTVRREYDGGSEVECLWMRDGGLVYFSDEKASYDGEEYEDLYGYYRGYNIYPDPEGETSLSHWVSAEEIPFGNETETLITNFFPAELSGDSGVLSEDA